MAKFEYSEFLDLLLELKNHEFEWDKGNEIKSELKHGFLSHEAEEVFYDDEMLVLGKQILPIVGESRFGIIGKTFEGRILFISFTIRNAKIRIISARTANVFERAEYEK